MRWKDMKRRLPAKVQIGPRIYYDVYYSTEPAVPGSVGLTDYDKKHIVIKKDLSDRQAVLTAFHEYLHAIDGVHGVGLTEVQVLKLEETFPYFVKFIQILLKRP